MSYKNKTEQAVMNMLKGSVHVWENLSKKENFTVQLVHTNYNAYAIYVNKMFTGAFINDSFINCDEAKEVGYKVKGKPTTELKQERALTAAELKKRKRAERKAKREQKQELFSESENDEFETL